MALKSKVKYGKLITLEQQGSTYYLMVDGKTYTYSTDLQTMIKAFDDY